MSAVLRVDWLPGSDRLHGRCHCGIETEAEDPVEMWAWLLAHPDHPSGGATPPLPPPPTQASPPAHLVSDPASIRGRSAVLL